MKKEWILKTFLVIVAFLILIKNQNQSQSQSQNKKSDETPSISNPIKTKQKLLIFSAEWCPACKKLKKELNDLNLKDFEIEIMDADKNKELKQKFKIKYLPTSIILIEEKEMSREIGYDRLKYQKWINENSKNNI
jgi:thiol-disulfide isomerase/thioredoxin